MNASKYEYQSEFARRYYGQGKAEGRVEGRAEGRLEGLMQGQAEGHAEGQAEGRMELVLKLLATKYGFLPAAMAARVRKANGAYVDEIAARVLTAETLHEALGLTCAQS